MEMEMANAKALKAGLIFMGLVCLFVWKLVSYFVSVMVR
jgi:hypothetical protein